MRMKKTFLKFFKKFQIEGRTTYMLNTHSFDILILSPQRLSNTAQAIFSTGSSEQTSSKYSTSVAHFLPKHNKVYVKLGLPH